jgi:hypothetical protein
MTDVADSAVITLKGLTPGYTYTLGIATTNWVNPLAGTAPTLDERHWGAFDNADGTDANINNSWIQINSSGDVFSIANYLDYGDTLELSSVNLGISDYTTTSKTYDNWKARLYVRIGSGVSGVAYPRTEADTSVATGTRFATNETKLLDIAAK